ncbi:hypothetical protein KVK98_05840 [Helicobacter pylori]|nr:hypothetical protein KVK98_05840 [Helicobacter pylori]
MTESPVKIYLDQHDLSRFFSSIPIKLDTNFSCHYTQTHAPLNGVKSIEQNALFNSFQIRLNNPLKRLKKPANPSLIWHLFGIKLF